MGTKCNETQEPMISALNSVWPIQILWLDPGNSPSLPVDLTTFLEHICYKPASNNQLSLCCTGLIA